MAGNQGAAGGYRAAIVGTGFMGRVHANAIRANGGQIRGVAGSSVERARAANAEIGAAEVFAEAEELIAHPDIEVVHICTPNWLHAPLGLAALRHGKHVVCEKPLATNVPDAVDLVSAAAEQSRVGAVPFVYRFHPMVRQAREMVRAGQLGTVRLIHGGYLQDWLMSAEDDNWRTDAAIGGPLRAFGDIGSHWCDMVEFVTGERITTLSAQLSQANPRPGDTEDIATLQFATATGAVGTAVISQVSAGRKNQLHFEITGAKSSLYFDQERSEELWHGRREAAALLTREPAILEPAAAKYSTVPAGHPQGYQDCFNAFVADTVAALRGESVDGLPVFTDGLRAACLAEAVAASARDRVWVEV